jgi:hypothetical protein
MIRRISDYVLNISRQERTAEVSRRLTFLLLYDVHRRPFCYDASAFIPRAGADVDDPVALRDNVHIVLYNDDGITRVN